MNTKEDMTLHFLKEIYYSSCIARIVCIENIGRGLLYIPIENIGRGLLYALHAAMCSFIKMNG